jgi:trehalose 2-sulfotransferase
MPAPTTTISYLVLATPRSGSTLLGQALNATDLAGDPREHFGHKMGFWARKWGTRGIRPFVARLLAERSTDNGVFGAKLLHAHLLHLERVARAEPEFADMPLADILRELFPDPRFFRITREDTVRQAISYWKAKQTGVWGQEEARAGRTGQGRRRAVKGSRQTGKEPAYDYAGIAALLAEIEDGEAGIARFFADTGFAPMHVVYEQFVRDYEGTTRRMLDHLGIVPPPDLEIGRPRTVKLADDTSEAWAARFRAERAERNAVGAA